MIEYIALIISLIAASPIIARFLIYFFYAPNLDIFFPGPNGLPNGRTVVRVSEISTDKGEKPLQIRNWDYKRDVQIELELVASEPLEVKSERRARFTEVGLRGPLKGSGFTFKIRPILLSGGGLVGWSFWFKPYPNEYTLEIIAHPKMKMSEFGLPVFFGEVDLKPVKKSFTMKP